MCLAEEPQRESPLVKAVITLPDHTNDICVALSDAHREWSSARYIPGIHSSLMLIAADELHATKLAPSADTSSGLNADNRQSVRLSVSTIGSFFHEQTVRGSYSAHNAVRIEPVDDTTEQIVPSTSATHRLIHTLGVGSLSKLAASWCTDVGHCTIFKSLGIHHRAHVRRLVVLPLPGQPP